MCLPPICFGVFLKKIERESLHDPFKLYLGFFVTKNQKQATVMLMHYAIYSSIFSFPPLYINYES